MATKTLNAEQKQWRAQEDMQTLRRYADIQLDKTRMNMAAKMLQSEKSLLDGAIKLTANKTAGGKRK